MEENVYLSLGSNLGDKTENLKEAITSLQKVFTVKAVSSFYHSEPVGLKEQPWFYNLVCHVSTALSPMEMLERLQGIEKKMGKNKQVLNGPRLIDLDILFYGEWVFSGDTLIIPHPRLTERAFVLWPLMEIAPDLVHPIYQVTIRGLWLARKDHLERIERVSSAQMTAMPYL